MSVAVGYVRMDVKAPSFENELRRGHNRSEDFVDYLLRHRYSNQPPGHASTTCCKHQHGLPTQTFQLSYLLTIVYILVKKKINFTRVLFKALLIPSAYTILLVDSFQMPLLQLLRLSHDGLQL